MRSREVVGSDILIIKTEDIVFYIKEDPVLAKTAEREEVSK